MSRPECVYEYGQAFRMELKTIAKGHRWPSFAVASKFTSQHQAVTEDDILHIRELPDFEGTSVLCVLHKRTETIPALLFQL